MHGAGSGRRAAAERRGGADKRSGYYGDAQQRVQLPPIVRAAAVVPTFLLVVVAAGVPHCWTRRRPVLPRVLVLSERPPPFVALFVAAFLSLCSASST